MPRSDRHQIERVTHPLQVILLHFQPRRSSHIAFIRSRKHLLSTDSRRGYRRLSSVISIRLFVLLPIDSRRIERFHHDSFRSQFQHLVEKGGDGFRVGVLNERNRLKRSVSYVLRDDGAEEGMKKIASTPERSREQRLREPVSPVKRGGRGSTDLAIQIHQIERKHSSTNFYRLDLDSFFRAIAQLLERTNDESRRVDRDNLGVENE